MKRLLFVLLLVLAMTASVGAGVLTKVNGATSESIYVSIRDNFGDPNTAVVVTTLDLYYVEQGLAVSAKIDCTALAAADSAYASGGAFHCGYGVVRIDLPNAALDTGVGKTVQVVVVSAGNQQAERTIQLSPAANATHVNSVATSSVTAVNANLGTTQAVSFTSVGGTQMPQVTTTALIGTSLTEAGGAGRLAASVSTWGNVATPAATAATVNQTGDSYARLGSPVGASISADLAAMQVQTGTIATAATASRFTLSTGFPAVANAYPAGMMLWVVDADDSKRYPGFIKTYTAGRVVTLESPLAITPANADVVVIPAAAVQPFTKTTVTSN